MKELVPEKLHVFGTKNYMIDYLESSGARVIAAMGAVPAHIAFCMDGNRRYARKGNLNEGAGHVAGFETMLRLLLGCYRLGVKTVTVYAFSIENFNRSPEESDTLFNLVRTRLWGMVKNRDSAMRRLGWHIRFPGSRDLLADDLVERIDEIESSTAGCKEMVVNICAPYTTRDDLAHALSVAATPTPSDSQSIASYAKKVSQARYMAPSEPLDIFVRTSGETRFSDFMCWEAASQCSFEFVPQLWPELTVWDLYRIVAKWQVHNLLKTKRRHPQPLNSLGSAPPVVSVSRKQKPGINADVSRTTGAKEEIQNGTAATGSVPSPSSEGSRRRDVSGEGSQVKSIGDSEKNKEPPQTETKKIHDPEVALGMQSLIIADDGERKEAASGDLPSEGILGTEKDHLKNADTAPQVLPITHEEGSAVIRCRNDTKVYKMQFDGVSTDESVSAKNCLLPQRPDSPEALADSM